MARFLPLALLLLVPLLPVGPARAQPPGAEAPRLDAHGDPLPPGALYRLGTNRLRHGYSLHWLAFTPDGQTLIGRSGGTNGVHFWEVETGRERLRLPAPPGGFHCSCLSRDGTLL